MIQERRKGRDRRKKPAEHLSATPDAPIDRELQGPLRPPRPAINLPMLPDGRIALPTGNPCEGCDHCCRYVSIEIDRPTTKRDFDNIRWYLLHKNISVMIDYEGDWLIQFDTPCEWLIEGRCGHYELRPGRLEFLRAPGALPAGATVTAGAIVAVHLHPREKGRLIGFQWILHALRVVRQAGHERAIRDRRFDSRWLRRRAHGEEPQGSQHDERDERCDDSEQERDQDSFQARPLGFRGGGGLPSPAPWGDPSGAG